MARSYKFGRTEGGAHCEGEFYKLITKLFLIYCKSTSANKNYKLT